MHRDVGFLLMLLTLVEGRGRGGGGSRSSFGGSRSSFGGSRSSFGSNSRISGGYSNSGRYGGAINRGAPRFTGSNYGYNAGYGRSTSSGGFGLGLGGGLLLGYTAGRLSSPGYGYGYGHSRPVSRNQNSYDRTRPISCYEGELDSEIVTDMDLDETATTCSVETDVCFGRVTLQVMNATYENGTVEVKGFLQVSKGCGKRQEFESEFGTKGTFNSRTQCFVTNIYNSTQVVDHNIGNASVEFVQVSSKIFVTEQVIIFIINGVTIEGFKVKMVIPCRHNFRN
ncbi:keratin, type II cytoskeletal 5 isoform X2 [Eurytemora carolleeae]|uniref:keratin, type II cytoskeletal 5 isoform X2 n=1 Tax=Eurytemora carolleeae TaxID=1294199 RepID=UPI000C764D14|nr:keratin, type II cytoskeletal 5 isoform X2 [Eurytemora carolleeae]XP_023320960.1 keratin, type II cytoskeletal 5 isoform X2 [Eurytemora carolleeae]XP_023320961.1 keratin, type II cytoskeletal 5 isoform X2 [Eurytemora carolleeae]XP_023320962.1 keratin, type II cytoskeletal 5 isoform X2 [Eurytemora carolleeae]XP_023320963.1 keratin, type II cytoskeletal 5 isoform X2 [Eurytemora carolleeae]|eukprot:XP_023320958.1 keratin, type II cytoskeletal 5-like isoform X2 [Eurytemora affinis]